MQCGFEYDEAKGWPEDGIAPGTRWDDIPDDWSCPDRGGVRFSTRSRDLSMVEVTCARCPALSDNERQGETGTMTTTQSRR